MILRNETTLPDGTLVAAEIIDLAAGTYSREEFGAVVVTRPLTADEVIAYAPAPDPVAVTLAEIKAQPTVTKRVDALLAALEAGTLVL